MEDPDIEDTVIGSSGTRAPSIPPVEEETVVKAPRQALVEPPAEIGQHVRPRVAGHLAIAPLFAPAQHVARHQVRVNGQSPIPLEAPVLVGRRPRVARVLREQTPILVAVTSLLNEVSSTHLEVHQHGSSVIVTDLHSTNGTVVRTPGSPPLTLRSGESLVVVPGARVEIGDGNVVEILAMQRIVPPDHGPFERLSP